VTQTGPVPGRAERSDRPERRDRPIDPRADSAAHKAQKGSGLWSRLREKFTK
jgi:hypothetical protein